MLQKRGYLHIVLWAVACAFVLKLAVLDTCTVPSPSMQDTIEPGDFLLVSKIAYGARTPAAIPFARINLPRFTLPGLGRPGRGDVLFFEFPHDPGDTTTGRPMMFVKRCVGLPGDTVGGKGGRVYVNGREFLFPATARAGAGSPLAFEPVIVPRRGQVVSLTGENLSRWEGIIRQEGHRFEKSPTGESTVDGRVCREYRLERNYYFVLGDNPGQSYDSRFWGFVPEENVLGKAILVYWSREEKTSGLWERLLSIRWERVGLRVL